MVKAITLHAPWADLILEGVKKYETRSRPMSYRGRLWLHNAQRYPSLQARRGAYRIIGSFYDSLGFPTLDLVDDDGKLLAPIRLGCVVGYVDVVDCLPIVADVAHHDGEQRVFPFPMSNGMPELWRTAKHSGPPVSLQSQLPYGDFMPGRWAIELANPVRVHPFPARGQQAVPWNLALP